METSSRCRASHSFPTRRRPGLIDLMAMAALFAAMTAAASEGPVDLSSLRGRVVYLDFWASWCAPCRQSFPWMQRMQDAYGTRGLVVLAVDVDLKRQDAERFLATFHPTFALKFDPQGELAEQYKVQGMPTAFVIDRHGVVRFTHIGFRPVDRAMYEAQLQQVLSE
jgi:thiol-disulfide isomerase/thioredoxin